MSIYCISLHGFNYKLNNVTLIMVLSALIQDYLILNELYYMYQCISGQYIAVSCRSPKLSGNEHSDASKLNRNTYNTYDKMLLLLSKADVTSWVPVGGDISH